MQAVFAAWAQAAAEGDPQAAGMRPRAGQARMAQAVAQAIADDATLVVEAGTGVGKTFAYLVPALLSGRKVLLSTATKALQDQLFLRDVPRLLQQLAVPLRLARLKGRSSYLCLHRLRQLEQGQPRLDPQVWRAVAQVRQWATATSSGDMAELPSWDEQAPVAPLVTSTRSNCLGRDCAFWQSCHVNQARAQALAADVCIVNHHLLFADQQLQDEGASALLPQVGVVVVDEAHQLNDVGVQFAGLSLSTRQIQHWLRDALRLTTAHARGLMPWRDCLGAVEQASRQWQTLLAGQPAGQRLPWQGLAPAGVEVVQWQQCIQQLGRSLRQTWLALGQVLETAPELQALHRRAGQLLQYLAWCMQPVPEDAVRWLEYSEQQWTLTQAPLSVARLLQALMAAGAQDGAGQAWILTSATLGDTPDLGWFTQACGLRQARVLRVSSPVDYPRQAALYVPEDFPLPAEQAQHSAAVAALAVQGARRLGGRTLVLTTTLRALRSIAGQVQQLLQQGQGAGPGQAGGPPLQLLVQGQASKQALIQRLSAGTQAGVGCILVASAALWEGVDIPGDALQLLLIDKLPFAPPDDPVVQARARQWQSWGLHAFDDYLLPEAALALKQGAGRLIRTEADRGILVVADVRLHRQSYGPRLLQALPPMRRLRTPEQWQQALEWLAEPPL